MDLTLDYNFLIKIHEFLGDSKFLQLFTETYPRLELYSMSKDWIYSKEYILKLKGSNGDIIVSWE